MGCIMHLSERYAMEVEYDGVHIMCKKTGVERYSLDPDQFKELMGYKEAIDKTLTTLRYKQNGIHPELMEMMSLNSTSFSCELEGRVKVNVNPDSPHNLHLVEKYYSIELTMEEFECMKWFDTILKYYQ